MSKNKKKANPNLMSRKNQPTQPGNPTQNGENARRPKRRYHRHATFLHLFTLISCLSLFVFFSIRIASLGLMEQQPTMCQGWIMENNPASGKMERRDFTASMSNTLELATLLDETKSVYASQKMEKYGEIVFHFSTTKRTRKFYISQDGVRDTQGWNRLKPVSLDAVHKILNSEQIKMVEEQTKN